MPMLIDTCHKFHNASDKYPRMRHFVTEMYTHVHISLQNGVLWHMKLVNFGMYAIGLVSNLFTEFGDYPV